MILVLKTADHTTQAWLYDGGKVARFVDWESGRNLSDDLLGHLKTLTGFKHLSGIVVFSGPGSFTSLRIGHTVANALADSLNIPVVGTRGEGWIEQGLKLVQTAKPGLPALPHYGAEANITKPKS
jgi:tRNA threonylcarbamoyladenosine biosynthesis protein TsaB